MGGQFEQTLQPAGVNENAIRVHENNGMVHIHDDKASAKVEVPVADFKKHMQSLDDPATNSVTLSDAARNTRAIIGKTPTGDVSVRVEKAAGMWGKLKEFAGKLH